MRTAAPKLIDFGIASSAGSRRVTLAISRKSWVPRSIFLPLEQGVKAESRPTRAAVSTPSASYSTKCSHREDPVSRAESLRRDERPIAQQPHSATRTRARHFTATPGSDLPCVAPRSRRPLCDRQRVCTGLAHLDEVKAADRPELHDWDWRRTPLASRLLSYAGLALIPITLFTLLLEVARHAH